MFWVLYGQFLSAPFIVWAQTKHLIFSNAVVAVKRSSMPRFYYSIYVVDMLDF